MRNVINLRQARKALTRREKAKKAEENRLKHGRAKAEKDAHSRETERAARRLESLRLETPNEDGA